jgi:2-oxoglutarate dehydrogenase E1 component
VTYGDTVSEEKDPSRSVARADGYNAGYAEQLYERSLRDRGLIPPSLADWVDGGAAPSVGARREAGAGALAAAEVPADRLRAAARAAALVEAYRELGHFAAHLDPLGSEPGGHPMLQPEFHGISQEELAEIPAAALGLERMGRTAADVIDRLRSIYCGPIGYELGHVENPAERDWLVDYIESGRHRVELSADESRALLERLTEVEGLERFLQRAYLGKKRFSIEGLDMMVPMMDEALRRGVASGTREALIGMSHRGRLNVLAHIIGRSYEAILAEFEDQAGEGVARLVPADGTGDVKYHLGAAGVAHTGAGPLDVYMAPNPSHLEHVDPVVEGMARAARDLRRRGERGGETPGAGPDAQPVLPILVHGDAAFMGEGVAAETLNLCRLVGYETGGTLHLIANNQLGFTTDPRDSRSTRYASDIAIGFRIPIVHVNADDPEACLAAARLAFEYRQSFLQDIMIDLVGYRRHGHNEGDEPGYTQPAMYGAIRDHPTVRTLWAGRLAESGIVPAEEASRLEDAVAEKLQAAREAVQAGGDRKGGDAERRSSPSAAERPLEAGLTGPDDPALVGTSVPRERILALDEGIHRWPDGFELFRKLDRQLERRREALTEGEPIDWAHAEALSFASLVTEGVAIRLSGEDTERGTFSQRHLVLHAADGSGSWVPLEHLSTDQATFEVWNSPLSEVAALGFEYGYSTIATEALTLWEAQFGDFANVGQAIIDQFIAAGRSKWGQESRLVLLLPHGYEGQGPEHSSARLERFLQLAGRGNLRVTYPTTPAQYFHLLRLQALRPSRRPLVVLTPKSLLRHPRARSPLAEIAEGRFRALLPEPAPEGEVGAGAAGSGAAGCRRVILCSGKVYYDLSGSEAREEAARRDEAPTTILRVEELYPFPAAEIRAALEDRGGLEEVVWAQEEPRNMGGWSFARPRLEALLPHGASLRYVGRPEMASPAEGYHAAHEREQRRIVRAAFGLEGQDAEA